MGSENKKAVLTFRNLVKVKKYYIAIPKYDGLSKEECQNLWTKVMAVLKSVNGDGYYEVVNTFDRIETCPDGIRNKNLYIISEELKIASRADELVFVRPYYMSPFSLHSSITDAIESTFSDQIQTITLDGSLFGLYGEEIMDENNKRINYIYKIKE